MKKIIALLAALVMVLSLTACFGGGNQNTSTADESKAADISTYDKDFKGLQKYIADHNSKGTTSEIYYAILGADNGVRYVINDNAYVEIYDFTKADNATAKAILEDIKDDGKFTPVADGATMAAIITDSGNFVVAWDESRNYDYAGKAGINDEMKANW